LSNLGSEEDAVKNYFHNLLASRSWMLFALPAVALAYSIVRVVVPAVIHAVVPEVVRSVLSFV
jgi:hypothetical protein